MGFDYQMEVSQIAELALLAAGGQRANYSVIGAPRGNQWRLSASTLEVAAIRAPLTRQYQ